MDAQALRDLQAPLKQQYRDAPESACVTFQATGSVEMDEIGCSVPGHAGTARAGLHAAAGGNGSLACSGDMLLEALVACSGVTFAAVATALGVSINSTRIEAEADLDFRGTLGVDRSVPVGIQAVRLRFIVDSSASDDELSKLVELSERYCVVLQTLAQPAGLSSELVRAT